MKKFLSKLPVMIVLLVLAVAILGLYIGMLARPVSYGMTYAYSETISEEDATLETPAGTTVSVEFEIVSDERAYMTAVTYSGIDMEGKKTSLWIIRNGDKIAIIMNTMTEEEYRQSVDALKANEEEWNAFWENGDNSSVIVRDVNAFKMTMPVDPGEEPMSMTCDGAIVFAVIMGVVEVALIAFAVISTIFFVKAKKNPQTEQEVEASDLLVFYCLF